MRWIAPALPVSNVPKCSCRDLIGKEPSNEVKIVGLNRLPALDCKLSKRGITAKIKRAEACNKAQPDIWFRKSNSLYGNAVYVGSTNRYSQGFSWKTRYRVWEGYICNRHAYPRFLKDLIQFAPFLLNERNLLEFLMGTHGEVQFLFSQFNGLFFQLLSV